MTELTQSLTHRLGPLPAWAWGLGLGGAIIAARAIKAWSRSQATEAAAQDAAASTENIPSMGPNKIGGLSTGGVITAATPLGTIYDPETGGYTSVTPTESGTITTNSKWRTAAQRWALDNTGASPTAVLGALNDYLDGVPLDDAAIAIVNGAIRAVGAPPEGAPTVTRRSATPSTDTPATTPTNQPGTYATNMAQALGFPVGYTLYANPNDPGLFQGNNPAGQMIEWRSGWSAPHIIEPP